MNKAILASNSRKSPSIGLAATFKARVLGDAGTFEGEACLVNLLKSFRFKGLWEKATVVLTPNGFKSAKLYAIKKTDGSTDFTSGGGGGSRINAAGNKVAVSSGVPKLDYTNGSCPEILLERASTNILLNSETLASQTVTTIPQGYVLSFYGTGTVTVGESTPVVRVGIGANTRVHVYFISSGGGKSITVSGTVKNAQLEPASTVYYNLPTSWIPTTSAAVTRSVSTLVKTGLSGTIDQAKGTIVFRLTRQGRGRLFGIDDGTNDNYIRIFDPSDSGFLQGQFAKGGTVVNPTVSIGVTAEITVAIRYNATKVDFYINGAFYYSLTNNTAFTAALSRFSFSPTESMVNRLKYFAYIPEYCTVDELINYSTP